MKTNIFAAVQCLLKKTKILEFNQYHKAHMSPFIIYADLESLIKNVDECKNNPEKSYATNVGKQISSSFPMSRKLSFKDKK